VVIAMPEGSTDKPDDFDDTNIKDKKGV